MKTKYIRSPQVSVQPLGDFRSIPAEISVSGPIDQAISSHREHPQETSTVAALPLFPVKSLRDSNPE
jgi:hypothetical protein